MVLRLKLLQSLIIGIIFLLLLLPQIILQVSLAAGNYEREIEQDFHIHSDYQGLEKIILQYPVANEALIDFSCSLNANSTNNVTILIEPQSEWNITPTKLHRGEMINGTVTNGYLDLDPDVASSFDLVVRRENITDEIWGHFFIGIITRGWSKVPWPIIPGIFLLFLLAIRHRRKKFR